MDRFPDIFDRTGAVPRPSYRQLAEEVRALFADAPPLPVVADLPAGDGRAVLVLPAFLTNDTATQPLRDFLEACGFRVFGWGLGVNWGPTETIMTGLRDRLKEVADLTGGPVALVGASLGGLLARDLAYDFPTYVRHVATLASPFRLPTASTIEPLVRLCLLAASPALQPDRLLSPLPVASTAFFTLDDGVVAWQSCQSDEEHCMNIAVTGAHATICRNPEVLSLLVRRLACAA